MRVSFKLCFYLFGLLTVASCRSGSFVVIESANQNSRVNYLVIHATSENFQESLRLLTTPTSNPVSAHYLVPVETDTSYPDQSLKIFSLVPEHRRAWHAGISQWGQETGLNDRSIGIEVVNEFNCAETEFDLQAVMPANLQCNFPPYSQAQIELLSTLIGDILLRYPGIDPINIVAHSDIALVRKSDPGPNFPWYDLYLQGIGAWPDEVDVNYFQLRLLEAKPSIDSLQMALALLGYGVEVTGTLDQATSFALRALQLHFRPADYSGDPDNETLAILWALIKKYRGDEFEEYSDELIFR